jgi:hypothetical protein
MNRSDFLNIIRNPSPTRQTVGEMSELIEIFPYFQGAHLLLLRMLHDTGDVKFGNQLRKSAIHIADRKVLYHHLSVIDGSGREEAPGTELQDGSEGIPPAGMESVKTSEDVQVMIAENNVLISDPLDQEEELVVPSAWSDAANMDSQNDQETGTREDDTDDEVEILVNPEILKDEDERIPDEVQVKSFNIEAVQDEVQEEPVAVETVKEEVQDKDEVQEELVAVETVKEEVQDKEEVQEEPVADETVKEEVQDKEEVQEKPVADEAVKDEIQGRLVADEPVQETAVLTGDVKPEVQGMADPEDREQTVIENGLSSDDMINEIEEESRIMNEAPLSGLHSIILSDEDAYDEDRLSMMFIDEEEEPEDEEVFYMDPGFSIPRPIDLLEIESEPSHFEKEDSNDTVAGKDFNAAAESNPEKKMSEADLIDLFISKNPRIEPQKEKSEVLMEDVSKSSAEEKGGFLTETLASIYIAQGYYSKAIDIYEKLTLKFPEKSSYFASLIQKVHELIKK